MKLTGENASNRIIASLLRINFMLNKYANVLEKSENKYYFNKFLYYFTLKNNKNIYYK